jgi:hypothetical protein
VSERTSFPELCRQVCDSQNWELLPTGIVVRWGDGRHQLVSLEPFEFEREELVRISSIIGHVAELTREQLVTALRANTRLAHGALAIRSEQLCMTDTLMLVEAGVDEIKAAIEYLARSADEYERSLFGTDEN